LERWLIAIANQREIAAPTTISKSKAPQTRGFFIGWTALGK
jgi:hypothetical protein